jgi:hypothetical protein
MLPLSTLRILLVAPLLLVAAASLGIGAAIVLWGRPLVLRGSHLSWALLAISAPVALAMVILAFSLADPGVTCSTILHIAVLAFLVVGTRRLMRGYLIIGISAESFRASLQASLARLGLPFEESVVGFELKSLRETLRTRITPSLGSAHFQMASSNHPEVLEQIGERVKGFLRAESTPPAMVAPLIYGIVGLAALALAVYQAQRF